MIEETDTTDNDTLDISKLEDVYGAVATESEVMRACLCEMYAQIASQVALTPHTTDWLRTLESLYCSLHDRGFHAAVPE